MKQVEDSCWVDKYKPKHSSELKGQSQNIRRLKAWISSFEPSKSKPILMHGPPGIGKTTAAHLVLKEAGYEVVEMNASDQRNKRVIEDIVRSMTNNSRINFFGRASETKDALIIDEVDGMAGNEDRGGIAALIQEIKRSKKPIIFICNDGQHKKIRSLLNYCDYPAMEFRRPEVEDVKAVVSKIAVQEDLTIDHRTMDEFIEATNRDIRQVINFLSLFKQTNKKQNFSIKTTRLNPFEATKKALTSDVSFEERNECFFSDYTIIPLFMFENYIRQQPAQTTRKPIKNTQLHLLANISKAIDGICLGDFLERQIRSNQNWSLLPLHAIFSTIYPSAFMNSGYPKRVEFPQFLGKISNANKRMRLQQELNSHMCLQLRGGFDADYYDLFSEHLTNPLVKDGANGVDKVLEFMSAYSLLREDMDSILELASWSFKQPAKIDPKAKAALTRAYKKADIKLPYAVDVGMSRKRKVAIPTEYELDNEDEDDVEDDDEDERKQDLPQPVKKPAVKGVPAKRAKK